MNETIFVLGLGETLKFFKDFDKPKIGVNDIWSRVETEMVVCVDRPHKFEPKRLLAIKNSKPKIFFSHLNEWRGVGDYYWQGRLNIINGSYKEGKVYQSNNSTFVASSIAYLMGAKNIVIYGADFISHKKLKGAHTISKIIKDYSWLNDNLKKRGVNMYVGHNASKLSDILPLWKG